MTSRSIMPLWSCFVRLVPILTSLSLAACGANSHTDTFDSTPSETSPPPGLSLIAGDIGGPGTRDGAGTEARFEYLRAITADAAGNVYVADDSVVRKISAQGIVTTLAGVRGVRGTSDGQGAAARFAYATRVAADAAGNVYVLDNRRLLPSPQPATVLRKISPEGTVTTVPTSDNTALELNDRVIAVDRSGNVYLFVTGDGRSAIRKISPDGSLTTLFATSFDGEAAEEAPVYGGRKSLPAIYSMAVDDAGTIYFADDAGAIRKMAPTGAVATVRAAVPVDDPAASQWVDGMAVDTSGNMYALVNRYLSNEKNRFGLYGVETTIVEKIAPGGEVTAITGSSTAAGSADGQGDAARIGQSMALALGHDGTLYVADQGNATVRKITQGGVVSTLAGKAMQWGSIDGAGAVARFKELRGIAADRHGNLYLADSLNQAIRRVDVTGAVSTVAGSPVAYAHVDGIGDAARLVYPFGLTSDAGGALFITDISRPLGEFRAMHSSIRKLSPPGMLSTIAGSDLVSFGCCVLGDIDGNGSAARFDDPESLAAGPDGDIYVADTLNCSIRRITPGGMVATVAGRSGECVSADGAAMEARFVAPRGIVSDSVGNLYVVDAGYIRGTNKFSGTIRKISPAGTVTTLVDISGSDSAGGGVAERFRLISGITADEHGNLYIADTGNHTIRKVTPQGVVSTIAGITGERGIVLGSLPGGLDSPYGVAYLGNKTLAVTTGVAVLKLVLP